MSKVIRLTENDLHRIVRNTLNEIGYSRLLKASEDNYNIGSLKLGKDEFDYQWGHNNVANAIDVIRDGLQHYMDKMSAQGISNNKQFNAALKGIEAIEAFFLRKIKQQGNLEMHRERVEDRYFDELNAKVKELYPELYDDKTNFNGREKFDWHKFDDEKFKNVMSQLSPEARYYFENYY